MLNDVLIEGQIITNYILHKNDDRFYYFLKIETKRTHDVSINKNDVDVINCMFPRSIVFNPVEMLNTGNKIKVRGVLESNKVHYGSQSFDLVYVVVKSIQTNVNNQGFKDKKSSPSTYQKSSTTSKHIKAKTTIKKHDSYNPKQGYSSAKPYHDNFPKERDIRSFITCTCGYKFLDHLNECPSCGKSVMEIFRTGIK